MLEKHRVLAYFYFSGIKALKRPLVIKENDGKTHITKKNIKP